MMQASGCGAAELATCGRDGAVRVWDTRQADTPVAAFEPSGADEVPHRPCLLGVQDRGGKNSQFLGSALTRTARACTDEQRIVIYPADMIFRICTAGAGRLVRCVRERIRRGRALPAGRL